MNILKVKIKKLHKDAVVPKYSKPGDGGLDLTAISIDDSNPEYISYDTGIAFEIPENYVGLVFPRSSISKKDLILANSVGVIDSNFRGSVQFRFKRIDMIFENYYQINDRIGQIIILPYPQIEFEEVDELSNTERGTGSFGSTGS
jgi:dUTP pyrophosphatase